MFILICHLPFATFSQTFRNAFDNYFASSGSHPGQGYSYRSEVDNILGVAECQYMESLLNMFKATKDVKYLDQFVIHAKRVFERRDDDIVYTYLQIVPSTGNNWGTTGENDFGYPYTANGCSSTPITNPYAISYGGYSCNSLLSSYGWSNVENSCTYFTQSVQHSGNIIYPMSEFIYFELTDGDYSAVASYPLPPEVQNNSTYPNNYANINNNSTYPLTINTFFDFATWLRRRVLETILFHENFWSTTTNSFTTPNGYTDVLTGGYLHDPCSSQIDQCNNDCSMGQALIYMYLTQQAASYGTQPPDLVDNSYPYLSRIQTIAGMLWANAIPSDGGLTARDPGAYIWFNDWPSTVVYTEDLAHAYIEMNFANLCYEYNLKDSYGNPLFSLTDMQHFANAFARNAYAGPGSSNIYPTMYGPGATSINNPAIIIGPYTYMTRYNPYIYSEVSDYFTYNALYNNSGDVEGYSQLSIFENTPLYPAASTNYTAYLNIFNPVAQLPASTNTWLAASSGDYDGTGTQEFVAATNTTDQLLIESVDPTSHQINSVASGTASRIPGNPIIGVASGKLIHSTSGPDVIASIDGFGNIDIEEKSSGTLTAILSLSYNIGITSPVAITSGNFDQYNLGDEMIIADNTGQLYMVEYINPAAFNTISIASTGLTGIVGLASGHFDNSGNEELAILDNSTGYIDIDEIQITYNSITSTYSYSLVTLYSYTAYAGNNEWDGITSGSFDGDGVDDVMVHNGYDGQFTLLKQKAGNIINEGSQAFPDGAHFPDGSVNDIPTTSPNWAWHMGLMTSLKSCPGATNAALVAFRNADGEVTLYDMEGHCESLQLNNTYIGDATSSPSAPTAPSAPSPYTSYNYIYAIDNPYDYSSGSGNTLDNAYTLDYDVSNTLTANAFIISDGANVLFRAGSAVILAPGFYGQTGSVLDAHIDGSISCSTHGYYVPVKPPHGNGSQPNISRNINKSMNADSLSLFVNQSITRGQFSIGLKTIDSTELNKNADVSIWNELGQRIYQNQMLVVVGQQLPVNLSSYPRGIYFIMVRTKDKVLHGKVILQ